MNRKRQSDHQQKPRLNIIPVGVGTVLSSMVIAGFLLGYLADYMFDTQPVFLMLFGLLGFIGGMMRVKDIVTADSKQQRQKNGRDGGI